MNPRSVTFLLSALIGGIIVLTHGDDDLRAIVAGRRGAHQVGIHAVFVIRLAGIGLTALVRRHEQRLACRCNFGIGPAHVLLNLGESKDIVLTVSELVILESERSMAKITKQSKRPEEPDQIRLQSVQRIIQSGENLYVR
jgi:hypothetical protein